MLEGLNSRDPLCWVVGKHFLQQIQSVVVQVLHVSDHLLQVLGRMNRPVNSRKLGELTHARPDIFVGSSQHSEDLLDLVLF